MEARSGPRCGVPPKAKAAPRRAVVTNVRHLGFAGSSVTQERKRAPEVGCTCAWFESMRNHAEKSPSGKGTAMTTSNKVGFVLLIVMVISAVAFCGKHDAGTPQPTPTPTPMRTAVQH